MANQNINAKVSNPTLSRDFFLDAVQGTVFTTNNLLDTNAAQNLGILIPGQSITNLQMTEVAGVGQWRIINSQNQMVSRFGFVSQAGYVDPSECIVAPYSILSTDLLQVFCKGTNAGANTSEVLGWITTSGGVESFQVTTTADNEMTAMTNSITGQSLGDWAFGKSLTRIRLQSQTDSFVTQVQVIDQTGSIVWSTYGNTRLPTAGGKSTTVNLDIPCSLTVQKGWALKVSTVA